MITENISATIGKGWVDMKKDLGGAVGAGLHGAAALLNQCLSMTGEDLDGQIRSVFAQAQEACNNG